MRPLRKKTTHIVIHRSETPIEAAIAYHGFIERDGRLLPCLPYDVKGSHALYANSYSIGLAVEGCFCSGYRAKHRHVTSEQLLTLVSTVKELQLLYAIPIENVIGHSALGLLGTTFPDKLLPATSCPGDLFPWADLHSGLLGYQKSQSKTEEGPP